MFDIKHRDGGETNRKHLPTVDRMVNMSVGSIKPADKNKQITKNRKNSVLETGCEPGTPKHRTGDRRETVPLPDRARETGDWGEGVSYMRSKALQEITVRNLVTWCVPRPLVG